MTLAIIIGCVIVAVVALRWKAAKKRGVIRPQLFSRVQFLEFFLQRGVSENISGEVYDVLYQEHPDCLRLSPEAGFSELLHIDPDDLEDDMRSIFLKLRPGSNFEKAAEDWLGGEIRTMEDLVLWANWAGGPGFASETGD